MDYLSFILVFLILGALIIALTCKKIRRVKYNEKKWSDIKELEKDYDVFMSEEYAYQVNDL